MAFEVTVALIGDRNAAPPGAISPADFRTPWEKREKVTLHVEEHESLHAVLTRAAEELDCPPFDSLIPEDSTLVEPFFFVAWHDANERLPLEARMDDELTLVDENGEAVWAITEKRDIPYRQVGASATAGVLDGDPFKLYLIRRYPQAGGVSADWGLLVQALEAAWRVVDGLGAAYGAYEAWRRVRERLAGRDALARRMPRWAQRNARPEHLREILGGKPWNPRELATVLGCTTGEAEQILGLFGYTERMNIGNTQREIRPATNQPRTRCLVFWLATSMKWSGASQTRKSTTSSLRRSSRRFYSASSTRGMSGRFRAKTRRPPCVPTHPRRLNSIPSRVSFANAWAGFRGALSKWAMRFSMTPSCPAHFHRDECAETAWLSGTGVALGSEMRIACVPRCYPRDSAVLSPGRATASRMSMDPSCRAART